MRFHAILNRDGGTLRTLDIDGFAAEIGRVIEEAGHEVDIDIVSGADVSAAIESAVSGAGEVVMIGGGDGTVSCAAGLLKDADKALAVLPAGTMNLFARSLGIPLDLHEAVAAFAMGEIRQVDLASADDTIFVHQFSVGIHVKMIRLREKRAFRSRIGKIWASVRASLSALFKPPRLKVELELDGKRSRVKTAGIGISNNLFGEGHLPFTDTPDGGVLGIYMTKARGPRDFVMLALGLLRGKWRGNEQVKVQTAREVKLTVDPRHTRMECAIDGELRDLKPVTKLKIHRRALKVLVPRAEEGV